MLKEFKIQNFKGWKDTGTIKMAPLTLFFGANSSGKSSIGHFLMLLKQTVDVSDRKAVLYSGDKHSAVQLGSFVDMVYEHKIDNNIIFDYIWNVSENFKIKDSISKKEYKVNDISFSSTVGMENQASRKLQVQHFEYHLLNNNNNVLDIEMKKAEEKNKYKIDAQQYKLKRNAGRAWSIGAPVRFYGFPDEVIAYYQNAEFVQKLNLLQEQLFRSIYYLGPLRTKTERLYTWAGNETDSVGFSGENTIAAMLAARQRKISLGYKKLNYPFEEVIARQLKKMKLIDSFRVKQISENRQEYEVKVKTKGSKSWVDLPDVGFGVSQVLPVLVQCFYAPANSIIIMEQPEIHLHPAAQSILADVVIDVINSRENGHDRNIQLIIETHSEHFLRRLQRRIAEDVIAKEKVSTYFAKIDRTPAKLEPLEIDIFGNIQNWPENFFGDEMEDISAQSKAALLRRKKEGNQ
jgi:predicted ATPase